MHLLLDLSGRTVIISGDHDATAIVTKFKNCVTGISAIPEVECLSYVAHSLA